MQVFFEIFSKITRLVFEPVCPCSRQFELRTNISCHKALQSLRKQTPEEKRLKALNGLKAFQMAILRSCLNHHWHCCRLSLSYINHLEQWSTFARSLKFLNPRTTTRQTRLYCVGSYLPWSLKLNSDFLEAEEIIYQLIAWSR